MKNINLAMVRASRGLRALGMGAALVLALNMAAQAQPGDFHDGPGGPGGPGGGGPGDMGMEFNPRMLRELHLAPDQEQKLKDSRLAFQKKKIQLFGQKASLELDLKSILSTYPVKKADALKVAEKIADVDKQTLLLKVDAMSQLLAGLTADQHAKLMEIQDEWMEKRKTWREEMEKDRHHFRDSKDGKDKDGKGEDN